MAWTEWTGHRQIDDTGPDHIDYIITFNGLVADTKPTNGQLITNVVSGLTLSSTGLDAEPRAVQVSQIYRLEDKVSSRVTVRFRGYYSGA